MIAFLDVQYTGDTALAACVLADTWDAATPRERLTVQLDHVEPYESGAFFKRELPCLLAVLAKAGPRVTCVVVDAYVWLDLAGTPGLGGHLFNALGARIPVIGIAKTAWRGSEMALRLPRPGTEKPLFLTAAGIPVDEALRLASTLHGAHRIPTLIGDVDRLARGR